MARMYTQDELDELAHQFESLLFVAETAIIIVDKQVSQRKTIGRMLEELHVEKDRVFEADDDIKAQPIIDKNTDKRLIIITDLNFSRPQCDGLKFITKLKKTPALASAQFIVITDERNKERAAAAMKLGLVGFFKKPLDLAQLKAKLVELNVAS